MADDVEVVFGANITALLNGIKGATSAIEGMTGPVRAITSSFSAMGEVLVAAFAVEKIEEFVKSMAELGEQTERTAAMLGESTERVGELKFIADSSGSSLEGMSMGMERLAFNAEKAAAGSAVEQDAFSRLGVSLKDASGNTKSLNELVLETADSFSKHADGAEKVALAYQLFGRAGVSMIPLLDKGRQGFQELSDTADKTGSVLSEQTVKGMVETQHSIVEMGAAFTGLGATIFTAFQPAIEGILNTVIGLIESFTSWADHSYSTGGAMKWLAMAADLVVTAIMAIVSTFEILWDIAAAIIQNLTDGLNALVEDITHMLEGDFSFSAKFDIAKPWEDAGTKIDKVLTDMMDNTLKMWKATLAPPQEITVTHHGPLDSFLPPKDMAAAKAALDALKATVKEVQSTFNSFFSSVIGGFDKAISGLINGTMNWKQAMFSVIDSIWSSLVKMIEDWVAKWLAGEATMLLFHNSASAEKIATDEAAQATSAASMITNAIMSILSSSKVTAAGVTANLAPTIGPAAIPAGIAAGAEVAALASFDVGAWELSRDQVAKVHKGEMIVPAAGGLADAVRDMLSGGGPGSGGTTHVHNWNGPVLDKEGLARTVASVMNRNPDLRGNW